MTTPTAMIPWDFDFFYLNGSEWTLLPSGSKAIECHVKINSENIRIAFPTNASETELATLNPNKFIRVGKNMLQNIPSVNVKYTAFEDNNPMKPAALELISVSHLDHIAQHSILRIVYSPETAEQWKKAIPSHQLGLPVVLNNYLCVVNSAEYGQGWPQIQQHVQEFNAEGMASTNICEMSYKPRMGLLKSGPRSIFTGYPNAKAEHSRRITLSTGMLDTKGYNIKIDDRAGDLITGDSPISKKR
ncbi:capsid protein VP1 [Trichonephila clavata]|uniref:Capsid protein VP1 n=1 Tax=Trichonephila clavata TaxID=2740835 RepID=A0A8X6GR30_TRICU|nr:capsid protein VP1 [Trichonephila clavata]